MIKNYELADGGRIAAATPEEFVRRLREGSWLESDCRVVVFLVHFAAGFKVVLGVEVWLDRAELLWPTSENSDTSERSAGIRCFFFSLELSV